MKDILDRLGKVIYWLCSTVSAFLIVGLICLLAYAATQRWPGSDDTLPMIAFTLLAAAGIWISGRAALYVLSGR